MCMVPYNEVNLDLGLLPEILDLQFVPPSQHCHEVSYGLEFAV